MKTEKPKIALCLSGQMRSYEECFSSLKKNILDELEPDVFIHTWSNTGCPTRPTEWKLSKLGKYDPRLRYRPHEYYVEEEEVVKEKLETLYNPLAMVIEDYKPEYTSAFKEVEVPAILKEKEDIACRSVIPMFYKIWACNELKKEHEKANQFSYDIVIRLRPDLRIDEPLPSHTLSDTNTLWYADYRVNHEVGIGDKLAYANSSIADYYASVWTLLNEYWKEPLGNGEWRDHRVNERLLRHHMEISTHPVKTFPLKCDFIRSDAKRGNTK